MASDKETKSYFQMLPPAIVAVCAIVGIVVVECFALSKGINGKLLSVAVVVIAGLGGFHFGKLKNLIREALK